MARRNTLEDRFRKDLLRKLEGYGYVWEEDDSTHPQPVGVRHLARFLDGLERKERREERVRKPQRRDRDEIVARQKKRRGRGDENG